MKDFSWLKRYQKWWTQAAAAGSILVLVLVAVIVRALLEPRPPQRVPLPKEPPPILHGPVPEPTISLRIAGTSRVLWLKVDDYVAGVVAGEMDPSWPEQALAAQAILARTFIMQKIESGMRSKYGTVASTDVTEFQAYKPSRINARVKAAVQATRGKVLTYNGRFIHAFFHSCSGGKTATAYEGLNFTGAPTPYLRPVEDGPCSNPEVENWSISASVSEIARVAGVKGFTDIKIGSHGPSGRALTIVVGNKEVSAVEMRNALGPNRMKSTLITSIERRAGRVYIKGKGWGHGVGMPQWSAHDRALRGETAAQILATYYPGTIIEQIWK